MILSAIRKRNTRRYKEILCTTPLPEVQNVMRAALNRVLAEEPSLGTENDYFFFDALRYGKDIGKTAGITVGIVPDDGPLRVKRKISFDVVAMSVHTADEIEEIVRHELSHIKNGDLTQIEAEIKKVVARYIAGNASFDDVMTQMNTNNEHTTARQINNWQPHEYRADTTLMRNADAAIGVLKKSRLSRLPTELVTRLYKQFPHPPPFLRILNIRRTQVARKLGLKS